MSDPNIIVGYHGIGKTYACRNVLDYSLNDFSLSFFDYGDVLLPNILLSSKQYDYVIIYNSDHVRELLKLNNINYYLIYPHVDLKESYINRFKSLHYDKVYIDNISDNWESELDKLSKETFPYKIELNDNTFLSDILSFNF